MASKTIKHAGKRQQTRRRVTLACARCHRKKVRCDNQKPRCSNCVHANTQCLGILDGASKTVVPRSIVQYLQDAIAQKELELRSRNIDVDDEGTPTPSQDTRLQPAQQLAQPAASAPHAGIRRPTKPKRSGRRSPSRMTTWLIENFEPGINAEFLRTESGFPVDLFLFSSSHLPPIIPPLGPVDEVEDDESVDDDSSHNYSAGRAEEESTELSQIPPQIAEQLAKNYLQNILPLYPFMEAEDVWARFRRVFPDTSKSGNTMPTEPSSYDIFVTSVMLCVSIMTSRFSDAVRIASSSEKIFRNALRHCHFSHSDLQTLQGILLLAEYAYLMPQPASIWETVNLSMRMALELGLHRDPDEAGWGSRDGRLGHQTSSPETDLRRRIFWCIYEMDRSICASSHRLLSVSEEMITTQYPIGDNVQRSCYVVVVQFRRIQSEIMTVNFLCSDLALGSSQGPKHAYDAWLPITERKIFAWRESIMTHQSRGPEWYDLAVYHGVVFLYRPSPRNPFPDPEALMKCFISATEVVYGYWEHAHSGFLKYSWHAVHHGFESASVMLYALRKCKDALRARYGIRRILEAVHMYSSLFILLSERWQKATTCSEMYERLKKDVLREVMRPDGPPHVDTGDELDKLVLPPEALARILAGGVTESPAGADEESRQHMQPSQAGFAAHSSQVVQESQASQGNLALLEPDMPVELPTALPDSMYLDMPDESAAQTPTTATTFTAETLPRFPLTPSTATTSVSAGSALDPSLLDSQVPPFDWTTFGPDAFMEPSFMLWYM